MSELYLAAVATHVLAAMVWVGGMVFFAIAAPVLRGVEDEGVRARLFDRLGRRFRVVGWLCVLLLLATGLVELRLRGWWGSGFWNATMLMDTPIGRSLLWKLALVAVMIGVQAVHDFHLGPAAGRAVPGTDEARALRVRSARLARVNALLALVLVWVAVRLGRGG